MDGLTYAQRREQNIRRNAQVLRDLGLEDHGLLIKPKAQSATRKKRKEEAVATELRVSLRSRNKLDYQELPNDYEEDASSSASEGEVITRTRKQRKVYSSEYDKRITIVNNNNELGELIKTAMNEYNVRKNIEELPVTDDDAVTEEQTSNTKSKKCKDTNLHIQKIQNEWLGHQFLPTDGSNQLKKAVMDKIGVNKVSFSRMSGIQPFKNGVVLFVNIGGDAYKNQFLVNKGEGFVLLTWFAQTQQTMESPVIKRMISKKEKTFLFLRHPNEAYVCCGELELHSFNEKVQPIKFLWKLKMDQLNFFKDLF